MTSNTIKNKKKKIPPCPPKPVINWAENESKNLRVWSRPLSDDENSILFFASECVDVKETNKRENREHEYVLMPWGKKFGVAKRKYGEMQAIKYFKDFNEACRFAIGLVSEDAGLLPKETTYDHAAVKKFNDWHDKYGEKDIVKRWNHSDKIDQGRC